jgi:hypothetical protein
MAINMFEGGRRIAKLLSVLWVAGFAFMFFGDPPSVSVKYEVRRPQQAPVLMPSDYDCNTDSRSEANWGRRTPSGTQYDIYVCFLARQFPDGQLVPYRVDSDGMMWGNTPYSDDVDSYADAAFKSWKPTPRDLEWIDSQKWVVRREHASEILPWLAGGVIVVLGLSTIIGWIVRGFAGIPRGRDSRPESN